MKFIVDAQLPQSLSTFLNEAGHDSIHTLDLTDKNKTTDRKIIDISIEQNRIVVSKDNDFLDSHLLKGKPPKLIILKTGNISNTMLLTLFQKNIEKISALFKEASLIEFYKDEVIVHNSK